MDSVARARMPVLARPSAWTGTDRAGVGVGAGAEAMIRWLALLLAG
jgi:hypothetical protein